MVMENIKEANVVTDKVPVGFKETEIGLIPNDWRMQTLQDLGNFSKGRGISRDEANSGNIPCIRYGELYTHHEDVIRSYPSKISPVVALDSKKLKKGDILFAGSGETKSDIGKCAAFIDDKEAYAGGDIVIFSPSNANSEFLGYLLNVPLIAWQKASKGQGDAVVHISATALSQIFIPFPPLSEQQAIAEALDDVDALIEGLEKLIAKKRLIKQGMMQNLLSGTNRFKAFTVERAIHKIGYKQTELGIIPEDWDKKTFGELFDFLTTGTNSRADLQANGDTFYVHYGDIHKKLNNHLDFRKASIPYIARQLCSNAAHLKNGDWIMVDASEDYDGVGKSIEVFGLLTGDKAVSGLHTFLLREKKTTFVIGFKGHLGNFIGLRKQYMRVMTGMKVFGVSKSALRDLVIPIPTIPEQHAIAEALSDADAEIDSIQQKLTKARQIKQGMMQELLTGRIRLI